jgi:Na+/proline symporter
LRGFFFGRGATRHARAAASSWQTAARRVEALSMTPVLAGILLYVVLQLVLGFVVSRHIRDEADYLLAGRSLGPALGFFTVFATWFGAETCIGAAGAIYADGLGGGTADPFGYAACLFAMGAFFALPLWRRGLMTVGDLFRQRYSPAVERLVVILVAPTSVLWAAAQIRAFGQVLAASSDLAVDTAIAFAAAVVIAYTVFGGLLADAVTDMVQGIALLIGLVIIAVLLHQRSGGLPQALAALDGQRLALHGAGDGVLLRLEAWAVPICGSVLAQELVSRVLAIRSPGLARRAVLSAGFFYLLVGLIPVSVGLLGPTLLPNLQDPEQILPLLAAELLSGGWYILFAGALVSAILSTVDSALLAAASIVSHNLLVSIFPAMSERAKLRSARAGVVIAGLVAYVMAMYAEGVYTLVEEASAFGSAGVFIVGSAALFTNFGGAGAAISSLLVGAVIYIAGSHWLEWQTPYLASLCGAGVTYLVVGFGERTLVRRGMTKRRLQQDW